MTRLSNRQFPLMEIFSKGNHLSIAQIQKLDQRPFRSFLVHTWVAYHPGKGFRITSQGRAAWDEFCTTSIDRKNPHMPLTRYFDPVAYGLDATYHKPKLQVVAGRGAA